MDLGGLGNTASSGGVNLSAQGYITSILHVAVSQFTSVIEKIADARAENGAEQNRVMQAMELLQTNLTNMEAGHGRIVDTDMAYESTKYARQNVLVQAGAAMTAQANQLTNILRDVGEDRHRGRIYLPLEDLNAFGYTEEQLFDGVVNDAWRELMAFQIQRAREWFRQSEAGVRFLAADARWPVWTSLRLYRGILSRIEQNQYDVFNRRAYVPRFRKLIDLPYSFLLSQSQ